MRMIRNIIDRIKLFFIRKKVDREAEKEALELLNSEHLDEW